MRTVRGGTHGLPQRELDRRERNRARAGPGDVPDFDGMKIGELRAAAKDLGINSKGMTKEVLVDKVKIAFYEGRTGR